MIFLNSLKVGDTFWYFSRVWVVLEDMVDGRMKCECLDDEGTPFLRANIRVESF